MEDYGRKAQLMAHLRNEEKPFSYEKFRPKYAFIPKNKDNITENYLNCIEEGLWTLTFPLKK